MMWRIRSPDDVVAEIRGPNALSALCTFLCKGLDSGHKAVRALNGMVIFRDRMDQQLCVGEWVVCEQGVNNGSPPLVVVIPEPPPERG